MSIKSVINLHKLRTVSIDFGWWPLNLRALSSEKGYLILNSLNFKLIKYTFNKIGVEGIGHIKIL